MRVYFRILAAVCSCVLVGACGKGDPATTAPKLTFETIVDNLDPAKNTELHYKEYWKSVDRQELASAGIVVTVKEVRNGAEITVANRSRPTTDGINMTLKVTDIPRAAKLKVGEAIKFKGLLRDYRNRHANEVVLFLEEVVVAD